MTKLIALTDLPGFTNLKNTNHAHILAAIYQAAISNTLPVALWRHPRTNDQQALVDFSGVVRPTKINFQNQTAGFAFAPFINEAGRSTLFLKAGLTLNTQGIYLHQAYPDDQNDHPGAMPTGKIHKRDHFLNHFQALMTTPYSPRWDWSVMPVTTERPTLCSKAEFCRLVERAIHYIKSTDIKKVVASRATAVSLPKHFNPVATFEMLCDRYPHAFVSLVSIPALGTWIGASPEILLTLTKAELNTVALAGTQARSNNLPLEDVVWGAKEVEEQALVSDYIRHFFQQLDLASFTEYGPRTVSAGNVVHLKTDFRVQPHKMSLPQLGNQILDELHPTSAVCGMPKKEALTFILEQEHYNRAFYSGFLGPIHINGQSQLCVNLRCMQLTADRAILYVGAGITKDSIPELEWQETVWKSKTLLPVLETTHAPEREPEPV